MLFFSFSEEAVFSNTGKGIPIKKDGSSKNKAIQNSDSCLYHIGSSTYTVNKETKTIKAEYTMSLRERFFLKVPVKRLPTPLPSKNVKSNNEKDWEGLESFKLSI